MSVSNSCSRMVDHSKPVLMVNGLERLDASVNYSSFYMFPFYFIKYRKRRKDLKFILNLEFAFVVLSFLI